MKLSKEENKIITELVNIYFMYNPQMNKGMAFRIKAWDIISAHYITLKKPYDDIKHCIESKPMCKLPIWEQFYKYFNKETDNKGYKGTITDSTNADDWI
jgi:hypothetical protein